MEIEKTLLTSSYSIKFEAKENGVILGHAFIIIIQNSRHAEPYALLEDVYVEQEYRGKGVGSQLIAQVLSVAKEKKCYKIIATSRHTKPDVHRLYEKIGFVNHGIEFRMTLSDSPIQTRD